MKVRGHYDGEVVILNEPVTVRGHAEVEVEFTGLAPTARPHDGGSSLPPLPSAEQMRVRAARMRETFAEWMADETGYDEETWPRLKEGLEENRRDAGDFRKLFRG